MPDLTVDTCPTCGLPAEVLERNDTEAIARCILLHDFTIPIKTVTLNVPERVPTAPVIPFPAPKASTRPEWARRMAWFAFGALAALLLVEAPVAALVLIPLSIPLIAVESARKSWRPLAPKARAPQAPLTGTDKDEGRKAA
ncbi:MAG TPA: hypothetical protein VG779_07865 [Actinomycetota bacterium]|nr:hypothetical protein [Actinomycetota bacterium]